MRSRGKRCSPAAFDPETRAWHPVPAVKLARTVTHHAPSIRPSEFFEKHPADRFGDLLAQTNVAGRVRAKRRVFRARIRSVQEAVGVEHVRLRKDSRRAMAFANTEPYQPAFGNKKPVVAEI